jgi:hypothetical protein
MFDYCVVGVDINEALHKSVKMLPTGLTVLTKDGPISVNYGDYLVKIGSGRYEVWSEGEFNERYQS